MKGRFTIPFFIFLSFISTSGYGQLVHVISDSTGMPLPNVLVYPQNKSIVLETNSKGNVNINEIQDSLPVVFQLSPDCTEAYTKQQIINQNFTVRLKECVFTLPETNVVFDLENKALQLTSPAALFISDSEIRNQSYASSADLLKASGSIMVQKTQAGGGSPVLRGFEANKLLLAIDGIRLNNAIYRSGHLQNAITIDNYSLQSVSVIQGPASVFFGSGALGGVINYHTLQPQFSDSAHNRVQVILDYSSADKGIASHADFELGYSRFSSLTSITVKRFGNIRMGQKRWFSVDSLYGITRHIVIQDEGNDTTIQNPNKTMQPNTGYKQYDFMQKFRLKLSDFIYLNTNFQYSTSSDIDRFDMLNDYEGENLKYAQWYYGPQKRLLASARLRFLKPNRIFSACKITTAYQKIDEDRISRRFRADSTLHQEEDVHVGILDIDFQKYFTANSDLHYGINTQYDKLFSTAFYQNPHQKTDAQTRYPDGGNYSFSASLYARYQKHFINRLQLSAGLHFNYSQLYSTFSNQFIKMPFNKVRIENVFPAGILQLTYEYGEKNKLYTIVSNAYRNPNIDDYGKIRVKANDITIPNNQLQPEFTYNAEIGWEHCMKNNFTIQLSGYYTLLKDAIVRTGYQLNGTDSLKYDGEMYKIIANTNATNALVWGANARIQYLNLLDKVSAINSNHYIKISSVINYTYGYNQTDDVPLGHIPPVFGRTDFVYHKQKTHLQLFAEYNGWKQLDDFSPFGEDNAEQATSKGYPAWFTLNAQYGYSIRNALTIQVGIYNIFDIQYKTFASAVSAPGRSLIFKLVLQR